MSHQQQPAPAKGTRILIVDDNADSASSLALVLTIRGHQVETANDGLRAVDLAGEFRPDFVLLDIAMPKLDGYEACRRIRQAPWGAEMTIVAVTGWPQAEAKRASEAAGFDHHLVKPIELTALERLLAGEPAA